MATGDLNACFAHQFADAFRLTAIEDLLGKVDLTAFDRLAETTTAADGWREHGAGIVQSNTRCRVGDLHSASSQRPAARFRPSASNGGNSGLRGEGLGP